MEKYDYNFYQNKSCRYYPCHSGIEEDRFSCSMCWCPWWGNCGTQKNGIDCKDCNLPHDKNFYNTMIEGVKVIHKEREKK